MLQRRFLPLSLALLLAVAVPNQAAANDSSAELGIGGLVLTKNDNIQMLSEDLFISREEINVRYRFYNHSTNDARVLVAFPMPEILRPEDRPENQDEGVSSQLENFEFVTRVNGQPVETQVEKKTISNGVDRTQVLLRAGIALNPGQAEKQLGKLTPAILEELINLGLVSEQGEGGPLLPNWTLKITYYWEQVFPADSELVIDHHYKPVAGGVVPMPANLLLDELAQRETRQKYCINDDLLESVRGTSFEQTWISYILTTGGNWSGPIGRFRLAVDKGSPSNLVSLCAEGVRKIGPTQFEVSKTDFIPHQDLSILILTPRQDFEAGPPYSGDLSSYSCEELWVRRNSIFKTAGYCFKTARAIARFGNAGCSYDNLDDVHLSPDDTKVVEQIKALEQSKRCPR